MLGERSGGPGLARRPLPADPGGRHVPGAADRHPPGGRSRLLRRRRLQGAGEDRPVVSPGSVRGQQQHWSTAHVTTDQNLLRHLQDCWNSCREIQHMECTYRGVYFSKLPWNAGSEADAGSHYKHAICYFWWASNISSNLAS